MRRALLVLALVLIGTSQSAAQWKAGADNSKLVTTAWVAEHLNDPDVVVLHSGDPVKYALGHIPGARSVEFSSGGFAAVAGSLEMPEPEALRAKLESLGISDKTRIVVYQAQQYFSPSTRLILTLNWAGLGDRVMLMDGGLASWMHEKRALSTETPVVTAGKLSPLKPQPVVATVEEVQQAIGKAGISIIDARDQGFYDGTMPGGRRDGPPAVGHIPGALSVPFNSVYALDESLKTVDELKKMFADAGVKPGDTIIGYCHVGQQATSMLFAAHTAGFNVKLYDGSMTEWIAKQLPLEVKK